MCTGGDGVPGGHAEALAMVASGLDYIASAAAEGELAEPVLGEVLLGLQSAGAKHAAARSEILSRFDAAGCHDSDAYQNSSSWLRDRAGMTLPAAKRQVKQMRTLRARPRLAAALAEGWLSESWLDKIVAWTKPVPEDMRDFTDEMVLSVIEAGGDLNDAYKVITAVLDSAHAQEQREPDADGPDGVGLDGGGFDDRSLRLETTLDGAGTLTGSLSPEAAAALQAVLESLGKKAGKEDIRTKAQRDHDALFDACRRLLGSRLLPARAGSTTRAEVHIAFADLMRLPGAEQLTDAWLRGRVGEAGWLLGKDAEAAGCDALVSPVVMGSPDWAAITEMVLLVVGALGQHGNHGDHGATVSGPAGGRDTAPVDGGVGCPPVPLPAEAWQGLVQAMGRLAIRFVSGPGAIASLLRTGLLPQPFAGKSIPLDVGFSNHVPDAIRRAVIARAGGYCEWPGGCDVPAAASDVHHLKHKADGGPTSVSGCGCFCSFHHLVCIHRWGWKIELQADSTFKATSPDGSQVIRGHPARGKRPPPSRAA
ncbi:MAG: DUF222 domain-containing protein [Nocardiopsaceae bacterium]|nr:DUF222 domain-containing protein [Nocardiopsaceae bacterium]